MTLEARAPTQYDELWRLANRIQNTEFVPVAFRGRPDAILAAVLYGRGIDVAEIVALQHIVVINGRTDADAQLKRALVKRAGHTLIPETRTATKATITGVRRDDRTSLTVSWTLEDAVRAQLVTLDQDGHPIAKTKSGAVLPWQAYTTVMLYNRASVELCNAHFSDVLAGFSPQPNVEAYDDELADREYQDDVGFDGPVEFGVNLDGTVGLVPSLPARTDSGGGEVPEVRPAPTGGTSRGGPEPQPDLDVEGLFTPGEAIAAVPDDDDPERPFE